MGSIRDTLDELLEAAASLTALTATHFFATLFHQLAYRTLLFWS